MSRLIAFGVQSYLNSFFCKNNSMIKHPFSFVCLAMMAVLSACESSDPVQNPEPKAAVAPVLGKVDARLASTALHNPTSYLVPQCYTKTIDSHGYGHNPCYICHTQNKAPNYLDDSGLQVELTLPEPASENHWANLFKDRTHEVAMMSDLSMMDYVKESNYIDANGQLLLAQRIQNNLPQWDVNQNGQWDGYTPDMYYHFDQDGFDHKPNGDYSGWRVFAYYPFPGTFMPTNGSMDDVMIRLPERFQQNEAGQFDLQVYKVNLAIVEALIKRRNVGIAAVDERVLKVDLDKDGQLATATQVTYDWAPKEKHFMSYVGKARVLFEKGDEHLSGGLYPLGTEFLHSVRYLDVNASDEVVLAPRMKELRYSRKKLWRNYYDNRVIADNETKERHDFPARTKTIYGNPEEGVENLQGWVLQGFIEEKDGQLRPQTYEEHGFCLGCHGGIGVTVDTTFAFDRKFDFEAYRSGWYHWQEKGLAGIPDPLRESDGEPEYSYYLKANLSGNEFRTNDEVIARFFDQYGQPKPDAFARLRTDISELLVPSPERAIMLNKAYKVIVNEQSYVEGRDGVIEPLFDTVHQTLEDGDKTGLTQILSAR